MQQPPVPTTSVADLPAVPDGVLLDVREDDEWAAGHAPTALHVPLGQLPQRLAEVDTTGHVAVICRSGARSGQAVGWLVAQGVDAVNVAGGMQAWEAAGRDVVSEDGTSPRVI